jgi:hypothetical protein
MNHTQDRTITFPDDDGAIALDSNSMTFTNKTIMGGASGNTVSANQIIGIPISASQPSNEQIMQYNSTSGEWEPVTFAGGGGALANQLWVIKDIKTIGTNAGTFTQDVWTKRDLNTITGSQSSDCGIVNSQIILTAGTYYFHANVPAVNVGYHVAKLYNVTETSDVGFGTSVQGVDVSEAAHSVIDLVISPSITTTYEVQHRCTSTSISIGFGVASGLAPETYTTIIVQKLN